MAADAAFSPTQPDTSEIKTLPAGMLLRSTAEGNYFDNGGRLFRPLFRYISEHDIAMTTPVEATIDDAAMMFWVAPGEVHKVAGNKDGVEVINIPERTVAVRGGKGAYNASNYRKTLAALRDWLADQPGWQPAGEPYGVFWHGPFTPWFLKSYEVHIPVQRAEDLSAYLWRSRVLIVETPSGKDPHFVEQQKRFDENKAAMHDRDLVVMTRFGAGAFQVTLIGKDGGRKWRQAEPLDLEELFRLIDGMPMRQAEMRRQASR